MRKYLLHFWLLAAIFSFTACDSSNNDEPWVEPQFDTEGVYILNEGGWNANNGALSYYNVETDKITNNVFLNQNKLKLGEIPSAMLIYNNRMFIVVYGSNTIFVTDLTGKLIENGVISFEKTEYKEPRNIVELNGKLYVNFNSGHLAQIDVNTLAIEKVIGIEKGSEKMTIASNKKLYIADADGGNGTTVSVVNLTSFSREKSITVALNPFDIVSDNLGNVYVASRGQSWANPKIPAVLSVINTSDNSVKVIGQDIATYIAVADSKVLLAFKTENSDKSPRTIYSYYDIYAKKHIDKPFFTLPADKPEEGKDAINHAAYLDQSYSITVDPIKKDIYITITDYIVTGRVYIFSEQGNYKTSFSSGGINPNGVAFVTKQVN